MFFFYVLVVLLRYTLVVSLDERSAPPECLTPDGQRGSCKPLKSCEHLFNMFKKQPLKEAEISHLRRSVCGKAPSKGPPNVCCPGVVESSGLDPSAAPLKASASEPLSECGTWGKHRRPSLFPIPDLGDWPWMAAVMIKPAKSDASPVKVCGGSLIAKDWVVLAAHCFLPDHVNVSVVSVRLADLNLNDSVIDDATPVDLSVAEVILHPQFSASPRSNDVAVLRLKNPVNFTRLIRPICLLSGDAKYKSVEFFNRKLPFITAWGGLNYTEAAATALQEAQVPIVDNEKCQRSYASQGVVIDKRVVCVEQAKWCIGDHAAMMLPFGKTFYLTGIASYAVGCDTRSFPAVYTKVAEFSEWISNVTQVPTGP